MHPDSTHVRAGLWPTVANLMGVACLLCNVATAQTRPSIADLQNRVTILESAPIQDLNGYLTLDMSSPNGPTVRVAGANLQVVNGLGATGTVNGLGNLVVGYDETDLTLPAVCSLGQYIDQTNCTLNGGTWAVSHKSGSHNIVVGPYHRYSRFGGLIAGEGNTLTGASASVSGGLRSTASNSYAAVSGGYLNLASNLYASVSGGYLNAASGNTASVSGGQQNTASGTTASVTGGALNTASATQSSVSGGLSRVVSTLRYWVAGSTLQPQ